MRALLPYLDIARPTHWFKNVFIVPGILLAACFGEGVVLSRGVLLAFAAACLVASSNYVLNEILDAPTDAFHPLKRARPIPSGRVRIPLAYAEFAALAVLGVGLAFAGGRALGLAALALWGMGILYNTPPIRLKDQPYLDVLSESVNNPIRLALGWFGAAPDAALPTLSAIVAYWMFGAFLMATKRFAEIRHIADAGVAGRYRKSFRFYNEERLMLSMFFYVALFGMASGVFIARYRTELVLAAPLVAWALAYYLRVGYKPNSAVQHPENLFGERRLMLIVLLAFAACAFLLLHDIPALSAAFAPHASPPPHHPPLSLPSSP